METVIRSVRNQTEAIRIYVLHQCNGRYFNDVVNFYSEFNYGCRARHLFVPFVTEPYVLFVDDDIEILDRTLVKRILATCERTQGVIGVCGIQINRAHPDRAYTTGKRVLTPQKHTVCDITVGYLHMIQCKTFFKVYNFDVALQDHADDDIFLSACFQKSGLQNYVVAGHGKTYRVLDTSAGLEHRPTHYSARDAATRRYFLNEI